MISWVLYTQMARPLVFWMLVALYINAVCALEFMETSFVKKGTRCMANITVYRKQPFKSRLFCTVACIEDNCDKFIWDSDNQMCMLHSDKDNVSPAIFIDTDWTLYRRIRKDQCSVAGYEFYPTLNMCYKFDKSIEATWVNAQQLCEEDGGNMVSISTTDALKKVMDFLQCARVWIGLRNDTWLNGEPFVHIFGPSTNFDNSDMEVPGDTDNTCGSIVQRHDEVYVVDNSCYIRERNFICEIKN